MPEREGEGRGREYVSFRLEEYETIPRPDGADEPPRLGRSTVLPDLVGAFPYLEGRIRPLVTSLDRDELVALWEQARDNDETYRLPPLDRWYAVVGRDEEDLGKVAAHLEDDDRVASVSIVRPGPDPCPSPGEDPLVVDQTHLVEAEEGIGAKKAWSCDGAVGKGVAFADVERGWTPDHDDLVAHGIPDPLTGTIRDKSRAHGTQVLGVVCAVSNGIHGIGVAPEPDAVYVASRWESSVPDAIAATTLKLAAGDVLLLEVQDLDEQGAYVPVELDDATYEFIRTATAIDITVVEAAGNGGPWGAGNDLDAYPALRRGTEIVQALFGRRGRRVRLLGQPADEYRDSGAILVAAGEHVGKGGGDKQWYRLKSSNHGSRIDCFAQGTPVASCSSDDYGATCYDATSLAETSAASAIVAGAAVALQGMARGAQLGPLPAPEARRLLRSAQTGTRPSPDEPTKIGVMPNLVALHENMVGEEEVVVDPMEEPQVSIAWRVSNLFGAARAFTVRVLEGPATADEEFLLEDETISSTGFRSASAWTPAHTPKRYVEAKAGDAHCCLEVEDQFARIEVRLSAAGALTIELRDAGFELVGSATGDENCPGGAEAEGQGEPEVLA